MAIHLTNEQQDQFIEKLDTLGDIDLVCKLLGVPWALAYRTRAADAAFRARWADVVTRAFQARIR